MELAVSLASGVRNVSVHWKRKPKIIGVSSAFQGRAENWVITEEEGGGTVACLNVARKEPEER